jgi:hypothetical protein
MVANNHQMASPCARAVVALQHERHAAQAGDASEAFE